MRADTTEPDVGEHNAIGMGRGRVGIGYMTGTAAASHVLGAVNAAASAEQMVSTDVQPVQLAAGFSRTYGDV